MADRDLRPGLEEVELQQPAGTVGGAPVGAAVKEERADLGQVVAEG